MYPLIIQHLCLLKHVTKDESINMPLINPFTALDKCSFQVCTNFSEKIHLCDVQCTRLGVKYFQKYLNANANTFKFLKCKCKYFSFLQMQIFFKSISNTFSNILKYFDRYRTPSQEKIEIIIKNKKFH